MIYTVTFNPALDYVIHIDELNQGKVNRFTGEDFFCGGKGINVSWILKELDVDSCALGFVAGFTGNLLYEGLKAQGIHTEFVHLKNGFSRINIKIKSKEETDLNGPGPAITGEAVEELFSKLERLVSGDTLVLSGSIPHTVCDDVYERILACLDNRGIRFVVDASGALLSGVLKYHPFLIKPNDHELSQTIGRDLKTSTEILEAAKEFQARGARNVLVSLAEEGALLIDEYGKEHKIRAVGGKAVNSVGAGDSMVAGFIAGYISTGDYHYALQLGVAAGSATAISEGLAKREKINELLRLL